VRNCAEPKPFSWVKPAYVGFSSSICTVQDHILSTAGDDVCVCVFCDKFSSDKRCRRRTQDLKVAVDPRSPPHLSKIQKKIANVKLWLGLKKICAPDVRRARETVRVGER
jgi:hypothetical protein